MKKKIFAIILSALMLLGASPLAMAATLGDIDGNGKIEATDARSALRAAVGLDKLTEDEIRAADVDFDGDVDATDARLILRAAVGLEELHTHSYTSAETTAPTCVKKGIKTFTCECGDSYTEDIPAAGHKEAVDKAVDPTCTEKGKTEGSHCSVCDKVIKAQKDIPATGHKVVDDDPKYPTCTEKGYTVGSHCSVCNTVIEAQEELPAIGHYIETKKAVEPTCTKDGLTEGTYCWDCGLVIKEQEIIPAKGHKEVTDKAVAPTCTEKGKTEGSRCSVCNEVIKAQKDVPAKGHTEVKDKAVAATCTAAGKTEGSHCSVCNKVIKAQTDVAVIAHNYQAIVTAPTCTAQGYTTHTCVCGDVYTDTFTEILPHNMGEWTVNGNVKTRTCSGCSKEETVIDTGDGKVEIDASEGPELEFSADSFEQTDETFKDVQKTVVESNETTGEVLNVFDVTLKNDNGTPVQPDNPVQVKLPINDELNRHYKVFRVNDDKTLTDMQARKEGAYMVFETDHFSIYVIVKQSVEESVHVYEQHTVEASCVADEYIAYKCIYCEYIDPDRIEVSGKYPDGTGHDFEKKTTVAPTCVDNGYDIQTCSVCSYEEKTNVVVALGHKAVTDKAVAATCTAVGKTEGSHCSVCNEVIKAQETIPATGHTEVTDEAVAATCTTAGKTEGSHCSVCNEVIKAQEAIPATGHTEVTDEAVAATCTEAGKTEGSHCSVCDKVIKAQKTIAAKGHTSVPDRAVAATCTEEGKTAGTHCSVCNAVIKAQETIPAKGHTEKTDKAVAATCTTAGKTEGSHCSVCNTVIRAQEAIPATGHTVVTDNAVEPTYTETGLTEGYHCSVCNTVIKAQEIIPSIGAAEEHDKYHDFRAISITGTTRCAYPDCEAELPAFNDIVNGLKSNKNGVNYFTGIYEDISHYDEPTLKGMLAGAMEGEDMKETTEITYTPIYIDRLITNNNFHSKGEAFVSDLSDADVKSVKLERVSTVGFVSQLPDKFTSGRSEYNLSAIKAYEFPELYKVTLVLPTQNADVKKPVTGTSVYDKIYNKDYNNTLEAMRKEVADSFDALANELTGLESMVKMKTSGTVKADLVVEYYITTDTFTPVAAKYNHVLDVEFDINLTGALNVNYLSMTQTMDMTSNTYYFFNNNFGMK